MKTPECWRPSSAVPSFSVFLPDRHISNTPPTPWCDVKHFSRESPDRQTDRLTHRQDKFYTLDCWRRREKSNREWSKHPQNEITYGMWSRFPIKPVPVEKTLFVGHFCIENMSNDFQTIVHMTILSGKSNNIFTQPGALEDARDIHILDVISGKIVFSQTTIIWSVLLYSCL